MTSRVNSSLKSGSILSWGFLHVILGAMDYQVFIREQKRLGWCLKHASKSSENYIEVPYPISSSVKISHSWQCFDIFKPSLLRNASLKVQACFQNHSSQMLKKPQVGSKPWQFPQLLFELRIRIQIDWRWQHIQILFFCLWRATHVLKICISKFLRKKQPNKLLYKKTTIIFKTVFMTIFQIPIPKYHSSRFLFTSVNQGLPQNLHCKHHQPWPTAKVFAHGHRYVASLCDTPIQKTILKKTSVEPQKVQVPRLFMRPQD